MAGSPMAGSPMAGSPMADGPEGAERTPLRPWDLPWWFRLGLPATVAFVLQTLLMRSGGRPWERAVGGGVAMAAFVAAWLRWRLPRQDAQRRAEESRVGVGGWSNPTRWQRLMDRWFGDRAGRRRSTNPLAGTRPRPRR